MVLGGLFGGAEMKPTEPSLAVIKIPEPSLRKGGQAEVPETPLYQQPSQTERELKLMEDHFSVRENRLQQLLEENQILQTKLDAKVESKLQAEPKMVIPRRLLRNFLEFHSIKSDNTLDPDLVEFMEFTDVEKEALENVLADTRRILFELEAERTSVVTQSTTSISVYIEPFEKEGQALREKLLHDINSVISGDRYELFLELAKGQLYSNYYGFGGSKFELTMTQPEGPNSLRATFGYTSPASSSSSDSGEGTSMSRGRGDLIEKYKHLIPGN